MEIKFIEAKEKDIGDILDMMANFNAIDHYPFDRKKCQENITVFMSMAHLGQIWTINLDDVTVGYIVLTFGFSFEYGGIDAFIDEFFIKEDYRSMGIGKESMEFIEIKTGQLGVNALHLEVENHNEKGNRL
jgi:GNAT superfamily N-acetyltransferase